MSLKQTVLNRLKNIPGWRTKRKLVVISVDDYGNVRLDSKKARKKMDKAGLKVHTRFDAYDTLETREDLEALYEVLTSVKDKNDRHAVFTTFALPCNINFEAMRIESNKRYIYELLPDTYEKLAGMQPEAYSGAWDLWQYGIQNGLMLPQFHGREHLNLKVFEDKLASNDHEVITALNNRSYTSLSSSGYANTSYTAAYEFEELDENKRFKEILHDGLNQFEKVFGYKSIHFNPPGGREHPMIHPFLKEKGIKYLDTPFIKHQHEGQGKYRKILNWTGKRNSEDQIYQVRNVVFEPTDNRGFDWVAYSLRQVATAFKLSKPAIISSHRVNFCGHIDEDNRNLGLGSLKVLLQQIVKRWPDVEFIAANELGEIINKNKL